MATTKQTPSTAGTKKKGLQRNNRIAGRLDAKRPKDHVVVNFGDGSGNDVFSVGTVLAAMRGDQAFSVNIGALKERSELLDQMVRAWISENITKVARCWMTCRDGAMLLLAVSATEEYDEKLHDSLINLSVDVNKTMANFPIRLRTMLLPGPDGDPENSFLDPVLRHRLHPAT